MINSQLVVPVELWEYFLNVCIEVPIFEQSFDFFLQ
jgi:hypothetical protein